MARFWLPGDFLDNQLHSLESILLPLIVTIPHTDKPVAVLRQSFLGTSLTWI
jgi:hypothetical protein